MGCQDELLGTEGVTESNMMDFLGVIEQRTIEVLNMYKACESKGDYPGMTEPAFAPDDIRVMK